MKKLLLSTSVIEAAAGVALIAVPSLVGHLLLGAELAGDSIVVARIAGIALLALGVSCWLAHWDGQSCAARGLITAMVIYNLGAVVVLGAAGIRSQHAGVALWPAVILHAAMAVWCITSLLKKTAPPASMGASAK